MTRHNWHPYCLCVWQVLARYIGFGFVLTIPLPSPRCSVSLYCPCSYLWVLRLFHIFGIFWATAMVVQFFACVFGLIFFWEAFSLYLFLFPRLAPKIRRLDLHHWCVYGLYVDIWNGNKRTENLEFITQPFRRFRF